MPNGRPHDHPVTDTIVHGLHPFPPDIEKLVIEVHARNPSVFHDLMWAPFHWEQRKFLPEARRLLQGLLDHHGDPIACKRLVEEYMAATGTNR